MKFMLPLLALGYAALASPTPSLPVNPGGIGGLYKGPNAEIIIKGPDGSVITATAEGGKIQDGVQPVVLSEQVVVQEVPRVAVATPIEAVAVSAPVVESQQSSDLIGPSGRISTHGSQSVVAGPASTTVTGPAVVAETVVRGPPILGSPVLSAALPIAAPIATVTGSPIATVAGVSAAPVAVTAAPVATIAAEVSPVSVTATPLAALAPLSVTPSPLAAVTAAELASASIPAGAVNSIQFSNTALNVPVVTVAADPPQAVATASASPYLSVASASTSSQGTAAIASASPNGATASVNANGNIVTSVTASPLSIVSSTVTPIVVNNGIQKLSSQVLQSEIARATQLLQDQIAIDNRQLAVNPALIQASNIIPPEIGVVNKGRLTPRPGDILTTPGLGTASTSTNIQREEGDAQLSVVTPNVLQGRISTELSPEQAIALQNQQILLNNQIQHAQQASGPRLIQATDPRLVNPQIVNITPRNDVLLASTTDPRLILNSNQVNTLANIQQHRLLSEELAKSGIDASQLQLTQVPLSAVSTLSGLPAGAWGRHGRDTKNKEN